MQRIFLFLITNIAIMVILSITLRILGVESLLMQNGSDLNINALVIFSGVFGFGGAFISLAISKWMAKRMTGAIVISSPKNNMEKWLIKTVKNQSEIVGIKMPEVAIFPSNQMNAPPKPKTPEKITRALIFKSLPFCMRRLSTPRILRVILKITIMAILVIKKRNILCILNP